MPVRKGSLQFIVDLIKNKHISADVDYSIADAAFNKGETAMTINGPWAGATPIKAVSTMVSRSCQPLKAKCRKPLSVCLTAGINAASPNKDLAAGSGKLPAD